MEFVTDGRTRLHIKARAILCVLLLALAGVVAGCNASSAPLHLPGGTYASAAYHFRLVYPSGWQVTVLPDASATIPLSLQITHAGSFQATGSLVSTLAVTVFNAHDPLEATPIATLEHRVKVPHSALQPITISGQTAYQDGPTTRHSPAGQPDVTHTDYYLLTSAYEYQLTTDAVAGDNADAALRSIVLSFTLTG